MTVFGIDKRAAKAAWTVALVALALYATFAARRTLFVFLLAILFSYMVSPLIDWLNRRTPAKFSHTASTVVVFSLLLLSLAALVTAAGPPIVDQASKLTEQLPELARGSNFIDRIPLPDWLTPYKARVMAFVQSQVEAGSSLAVPLARQVGLTALQIVGNLVFVVLIPLLAFLFIKDGATMHQKFVQWSSNQRHAKMWRDIVDDLDTLLGRYMRALLTLSLVTIVVYGAVFSIAGVPYGLLLATVAGVLEFIPVIGPLAAAVLCLVVAGLSGYEYLLPLLIFIGVYRMFQDYVLNPYLMSDGVEVSPLLVLFGLLAGEELAGVIGIFLSVPVLATAKIVLRRVMQAARADEGQAEPVALEALPEPVRK